MPSDAKTLLQRYQLRPKSSFGQNFLVSESCIQRIAALCVQAPNTLVVEIGAGLGALTNALLSREAKVYAIERDRELIPVLQTEWQTAIENSRLEVIEADAATVDWQPWFFAHRGPRVLAGNLPYQITGRLIARATELHGLISRAVFMVQREVADRLAASANDEAYGQLSVFVQAAFRVEKAFVVGAGNFLPAPNVESAVVVLHPLEQRKALETPMFQAVVHAAFSQRRKTLRNALKIFLKDTEKSKSIEEKGIDLSRRGETLSVEEFATLCRLLEEK